MMVSGDMSWISKLGFVLKEWRWNQAHWWLFSSHNCLKRVPAKWVSVGVFCWFGPSGRSDSWKDSSELILQVVTGLEVHEE
ncbi:hypothetical protein C5167_022473 [Papaver somniferum]|uniref:Uncharacterized protein n=1 Tax=Papaver somniferum TaxID=3469 RepID=A0A4Y7JJI5_PAPSO|nr:hypothetical protein C5167_022473 [Papaver somniferum]